MLWQHQSEALDFARSRLFKNADRCLISIPPGTGKTEIAVRLAIDWVTSANLRKCLICVPNTPILKQFYTRLVCLTPIHVGIDQASHLAVKSDRLVLASQLSVINRLSKFTSGDYLVIIDEAHHTNYQASEFLALANSFDRVLGLTATPWTDGCLSLFNGAKRFFLSLSEARRRNLVSPYAIKEWSDPNGYHGLVFCESNAECERLSNLHSGSAWIGVNRSAFENQSAIMAWKSKRVGTLYVNRMLLEGFDSKHCADVWINRETYSDVFIAQMCGRALRYVPHKVASLHCRSKAVMSLVGSALARLDRE